MPKMPPKPKPKNHGSPQAAYERYKRETTYGPTGGAQPRPTRSGDRSRPKPNPGSPTAAAERRKRATNPGSPTAAAERQKRATTYGPTGGAQSTPSGRRAANTGKPKPVNPGGVLNSAEKNLAVRLSKVDYDALGRLMKAAGHGAYGRKGTNKGKPKTTLPKTK